MKMKRILLVLTISIFMCISNIQPGVFAEDSYYEYAILTDDGDLIFFNSYNHYPSRKTVTVTDLTGNEYTGLVYSNVDDTGNSNPPWYNDRTSIYNSYVARGNVIKPSSMRRWFYGATNLESFDGSGFDTSNVTDMQNMFYGCSSLASVDLSSFDINSFDTSNVKYMSGMFNGCSSLATLDLSSFDTSNVKTMTTMFSGCSSLTSLYISNFDTSNVTSMTGMFSRCSSLTSIEVNNFNTANTAGMALMFDGCSSLTSLELGNFDTSNVTDMEEMFKECSSLTSLDLSSFNTSKVTSMKGMFSGCSSLLELDLLSFDTSNVTNMDNMFLDCSSLTLLDLSNFDVRNVQSTIGMFNKDSLLKTIYASELFALPSLVREFSFGMFSYCDNLVGGNGTKFDINHSNSEYARIDKEEQPGYFTDKKTAIAINPPVLSNESMNTNGVTLKWSTVAGADEYVVYRKQGTGSYEEVGRSTTTSYTDKTALAGTKYTYAVKAHNTTTGKYSDYSAEKTLTYNPFKDVKSTSAHYKNIMWAFNKDLVNGTSKTTFSPEGTCMRKSFAIMLWKLNGRPASSGTNPFTDIDGLTSNEKKAIQWCYKNKIVSGMTKTTFAPEGDVTRKAVVIMLWKAAGRPAVVGSDNPFTDISKLSANEKSAILWAYENGITKGTTKTTFGPEENCTREQLCTFLARYNNLLHIMD